MRLNRQEFIGAITSLSKRNKVVFAVLLAIFVVSILGIIWRFNEHFMVTVATPGGSISEGVIGSPRFINPLLAVSDADRDLTTLAYAGLLRAGTGTELIPDLAAHYEISPDGLQYTFTLRNNLRWPDGTPITTDDIVYTVEKVQDPLIKSSKRAGWDGVQVTKVSSTVVRFTLKQPYASFLDNTTLGILPKHIWEKLSDDSFTAPNDLNAAPIGAGPYQIKAAKINKGADGIPTSYTLTPNPNFALGPAKISTITLHFYANSDDLLAAYKRGEISEIHSIDASTTKELATKGAHVITEPLPRVYGVFFNQGQSPVLADHAVRQALNLATNREEIIKQVLQGYGAPILGPLPPLTLASTPDNTASSSANLAQAGSILDAAGWTMGPDGFRAKVVNKKSVPLKFDISTSNTPELVAAARLIAAEWKVLGVDVQVKPYDIGTLNQAIIRPRKYEALFFGEVLPGRTPDPYAFWHSSQRLDPGLNIAMYANSKVDKILEQARSSASSTDRTELYSQFEDSIKDDAPAVFVYSPYFLYIIPTSVHHIEPTLMTTPAERFLSVYSWYINTDRVWKVFANPNNIIKQ